MLEASIAIEAGAQPVRAGPGDRRLPASRGFEEREEPEAEPRRDTGERDRTNELKREAGWSWLRPFRRLDEYERAVAELEAAEAAEQVAARAAAWPAEHRRSTATSGR